MVAANKDPSCNSNNNWRLNKIEKIDQKKIDNTTITTSYNNNTSLGEVREPSQITFAFFGI